MNLSHNIPLKSDQPQRYGCPKPIYEGFRYIELLRLFMKSHCPVECNWLSELKSLDFPWG